MWFFIAALGAVLLAATALFVRKLTKLLPGGVVVTYLFIGMALLYGLQAFLIERVGIAAHRDYLWLAVLAGVFSCVANNFDIRSLAWAPNPGLPTAVKNFQVVWVSIFAVPLIGDRPLELIEWIGVSGVLLGVITLGLTERSRNIEEDGKRTRPLVPCGFSGGVLSRRHGAYDS